MKKYDVLLGNIKVGETEIETDGLYSRFRCRCKLPDKGVHRVVAVYKAGSLDLGICVPDGTYFSARAKIPTKLLGTGEPHFYAISAEAEDAVFVPLDEQKSFEYISRLTEARFTIRAGKKGLLLNDKR